jgi:hypothetical protein
LVASSSRATVLSACNALVDNILSVSAPLADHVVKSGEMVVIDVKNSREMEDNKLEEGDICFNQDHDSNCDPTQVSQCQVDTNKEQLQHPGAPLFEPLFDIKQAECYEHNVK